MKKIGIYFSGTGNSRIALKEFLDKLVEDYNISSIEDENIKKLIEDSDEIFLSYPIYYSNIPLILRNFIVDNKSIWKGKKVFIIATMGLFSGDGAGCSARLLKKYGANIVGGLHLKMTDCIIDVSLLKKSDVQEEKILEKTIKKINRSANLYRNHKMTKDGLNVFNHIAGLFGQRLWFYKMTNSYKDKPKINREKCINCNKCVKNCPMNNLIIGKSGEISNMKKCTLCYRCVHICQEKAITILGKNIVHKQSNINMDNI